MKQIEELLAIRAEAEIVRWFSEMVRGALYTSHEMSRVFMGYLRVVWLWTHAQIPENHWQCEIRPSRDKSRDTFSMYFPEWLSERGSSHLTHVFALSSFLQKKLSEQCYNSPITLLKLNYKT